MAAIFEMSFESETLTKLELTEITGSSRRSDQIIWLKTHNCQFVMTKGGDPVVGRLHARLKLAGISTVLTDASVITKGPDMSKVR